MEYLFQFYILAAPILLAVGVAWSPIAIAVGIVVGRKQRLTGSVDMASAWHFVYVVALHSAMMVLPWVYLFACWIGKPVPFRLIQFGYAMMYLRWFFTPAWLGVYVAFRSLVDDVTNLREINEIALDIIFLISMILLIGLNWYVLFRSLSGLLKKKFSMNIRSELPFPSHDSYYLKPIFLWLAIEIGTLFIGGYIFIFFWGFFLSLAY